MEHQYSYTISTELFGKSVELLHKYFGITLAYFEPEFQQLPSFAKNITSLTPYKDTLNDEESITLTGYMYKEYTEILFDGIKEDDEIDSTIISAVTILQAVLIQERHNQVSEEFSIIMEEEWMYNLVREDLLKLFIFMHGKDFKTQRVSIKRDRKTLKLENSYNWIFDRMATLYLKKYLADITTVEQAQKELATYKKKGGRPHENKNVNIVLYGIYRMFTEEKKMKSKASDALCNMIVNFLKLTGLVRENDVYVNKAWVRSQIRYMSEQDAPPRFVERGTEFIPCKMSDLEGLGQPMF